VAADVLQILRTHAVCGRNHVLLVILLVLAAPSVAIDMMGAVKDTCEESYITTIDGGVELASEIAFESVVFGVTIWKTWSMVRDAEVARLSSNTITHSIFQNGIIYYAAALSVLLIELIAWASPQTMIASEVLYSTTELRFPVRFALISQFMLDLRVRAEVRTNSSSLRTIQTNSHAATLNFLQDAVNEDFGEPLYLPAHNVDRWNEAEVEQGMEPGDGAGGSIPQRISTGGKLR